MIPLPPAFQPGPDDQDYLCFRNHWLEPKHKVVDRRLVQSVAFYGANCETGEGITQEIIKDTMIYARLPNFISRQHTLISPKCYKHPLWAYLNK